MIELTPAQARAVAELAAQEGKLSLHQLAHAEGVAAADVYATPLGGAKGYRIALDGAVAQIGKTLPAPAG